MTAAEDARATLEHLFRTALDAVEPGRAVRERIPCDAGAPSLDGDPLDEARWIVLAAGKAAVPMAAAVEDLAPERVAGGLVVTRHGHGGTLAKLPRLEAAHPVPDARSEAAGRALLAAAASCPPDALLLVLLSGGASSLTATPLPGLTLDDVASTTGLLLAAGAPIDELNCVRKHLCELVGGRLARAARGKRLELLAVSDVPGDRLDVIGSGPCSADPTRYRDALAVLERRGILARVPDAVRAHLEAGVRGERAESAKPDDACFARVRARVVASNREARAAVVREARARGIRAFDLGAPLRGEARDVGRRLAALARSARVDAPTLLVLGGETTVTVRGDGRGGRSQELALAAGLALDGAGGAALLAAGTDGSDGPTDATGAVADGATVRRGAARGADAAGALARNDSHGFFRVEGGLLRTGPTGTNVMDLALLLLWPEGPPPAGRDLLPRGERSV